jgi:hypothetical protein
MEIFNRKRRVALGSFTDNVTNSSVFTFSHTLQETPAHVSVTPMNLASAGLFYVNWDSTNIIVTYTSNITGQIILDWTAIAV